MTKQNNKIAHKKYLFRSGDGFRIKWDLIIMTLAIYNCFMVPVQFSFDPDYAYSIWFNCIELSINLFFIADIVISFRTTYIHSKTGEEVMEIKAIAKKYLQMRFWVDLLASIPFDTIGLIFFSSNSGSMLQLFSLLKLTRVLRLGRIIAIMKVKDDIKLSLRLLKLIFFLILYLH